MPLGPRLDRPSAIGDEGRPRATSLTVVSLLVIGALVTVGFRNGQPLQFTSTGLLVGLTTAGFALLDRDRLGPKVLGHLCFLPAAVIVAYLLVASGFAVLSVGKVVLTAGSLTAMFGVTAGWNDIFDRATVRETLVASGSSYVFWVLGLVVLLFLSIFGWIGWTILNFLVGGAGPLVGLLGVFGMTGVALSCLYVAVRTVPAVQLAPESRRAATRERYARLKTRLLQAVVGSWGGLVIGVLATAVGLLGTLVVPLAPVLSVLTSLLTAVLAVFSAVAVVLTLAIWGVRRAVSDSGSASTRTVAAAIAAVAYMFGFLLAIPAAFRYGAPGLLFATPILPIFIYVVLAALLLGFYVGIVPERAGPAALSAAGLVAIGLGAALSGYPSLFVFGAVAGGLVAWDVGTFGLGVTAELGHIPETRRLELYHGVFAAGVGLVGVAALAVIDAARQSFVGGLGTPAAMAIAVVGVVMLLLPLRG